MPFALQFLRQSVTIPRTESDFHEVLVSEKSNTIIGKDSCIYIAGKLCKKYLLVQYFENHDDPCCLVSHIPYLQAMLDAATIKIYKLSLYRQGFFLL